jgi:hypothetical protein
MLLKSIPQYFDSPVSAQWLHDKASTGSHKASDSLRSLLEFAAPATLGGDPFNDLTSGELEVRLAELVRKSSPTVDEADRSISMVMQWAWPPVEGGWAHYDHQELLVAVDALCALLCAEDPQLLVRRLLEHYHSEQADSMDFQELGENLNVLHIPKEVLVNCAQFTPHHSHLLDGYAAL